MSTIWHATGHVAVGRRKVHVVFCDIDSGIVFTFDTHVGKVAITIITIVIIVLISVIAMLLVASGSIAHGAFLAATAAVVSTNVGVGVVVAAQWRRNIHRRGRHDGVAHVIVA